MAKNMNRHGLVNTTFKTQPTADNKLAIQEESLSPNAQNELDKISAELESMFKQQGYSVEVDQYKNIKGLGFYMTISKKKNSPGLCVVSVFYSDDLNKFSVSYRRSVKFFESPEEVIRYVKGLHIVCESMSRVNKTESRRSKMKLKINESAIYDLKEITGYDKEEIFRDDYYEDLEELWDNAEDIDDFIYDCFSEWLDEDFIYEFLTDRVGIDPNGLKDKIHEIYIYWRGDDV